MLDSSDSKKGLIDCLRTLSPLARTHIHLHTHIHTRARTYIHNQSSGGSSFRRNSETADIEKFKSYLSELEGLKDSDVEGIKSLTGKMVACIEIPEGFQNSFIRKNKKKE